MRKNNAVDGVNNFCHQSTMPKFPPKFDEVEESSSEENDEQVDESGSEVDEEVALEDIEEGVVDADAVPTQKVEIDNPVCPVPV